MRLAPVLVLASVVGGLCAFGWHDRSWIPFAIAAVVVVLALTVFRGMFRKDWK